MQRITIIEAENEEYGGLRFYAAFSDTTPREALTWYARVHDMDLPITPRKTGALQLGDTEAVAFEVRLEGLPT